MNRFRTVLFLSLFPAALSMSGCVVHDREVVVERPHERRVIVEERRYGPPPPVVVVEEHRHYGPPPEVIIERGPRRW